MFSGALRRIGIESVSGEEAPLAAPSSRFPSAENGYDREVVDRFVAYTKSLYDTHSKSLAALEESRSQQAELESEVDRLNRVIESLGQDGGNSDTSPSEIEALKAQLASAQESAEKAVRLEKEIEHLTRQLMSAKESVEQASFLVNQAKERAVDAMARAKKAEQNLETARSAAKHSQSEADSEANRLIAEVRADAEQKIAEAVSRAERLEIQLELAQRNGFELQPDGTFTINLAKLHAPAPSESERLDRITASVAKRKTNALPKLGIEEADIWTKHLSNKNR